nr:immunoglobulin heavy chain junction region [Macaca mulatta]MOW75338.1 immunoglobulin heavy chain junction region [Macaca mulatta]MOW76177.1 immunoglobulin heavy chain junction region [Macaca mulatta]MOW77176.1 immunoglobulin heavy chain junction region [Macaca mulatta]MOW77865.1 immunoglobulin heavy chain junction region [Macaca mulatta]
CATDAFGSGIDFW